MRTQLMSKTAARSLWRATALAALTLVAALPSACATSPGTAGKAAFDKGAGSYTAPSDRVSSGYTRLPVR